MTAGPAGEEKVLRRTLCLAACFAAAIVAMSWHTESRAANSGNANGSAADSSQPDGRPTNTWDQKAAAAYLDQRAGWWMEWPRAARDHGTFCVSCHTAVPYAMSRPLLRGPLAEQGPSANEQKLLNNVIKRVRLWKEVAPFYTDADRGIYKSVESRGTESVLNALILASHDASSAAGGAQSGHLSGDTLTAFENMWEEQETTGDDKGAWRWLRFKNEPWEADDSGYYGAALAAVAVGTAPENYRARPEIQNNLKILREYFESRECGADLDQSRCSTVGLGENARIARARSAEGHHRRTLEQAAGRRWLEFVFAGWGLEAARWHAARTAERRLRDGLGHIRAAAGGHSANERAIEDRTCMVSKKSGQGARLLARLFSEQKRGTPHQS